MRLLNLIAAFALLVTAAGSVGAGGNAAAEACSTEQMQTSPDDAIEACSALLGRDDLDPQRRAAALLVRGDAYHRTRRVELAGADYDAAVALAPESDAPYAALGNLALGLGEAHAVELLSKAIEINPRNAGALRDIGILKVGAGQLDVGIGYLSQALAIDPGEPNALYSRALSYRDRQHYLLALKDANALVAIAPDTINRAGRIDPCGCLRNFHVLALDLRASVLAAMGKLDAAEADLNAAVDYKRGYDALEARGEFLIDHGRRAAGLSDLDAALALEPDHSNAWYARGAALVDHPREAVRSFDLALALHPGYGYALFMRARSLRTLGRIEEAVRDYEAAVGASQRARDYAIPPLQRAGYWRSPDMPSELTPALHDAIQACMLDPTCN